MTQVGNRSGVPASRSHPRACDSSNQARGSRALQTLTCFCTGPQPETFSKNLNHWGIKGEVCVSSAPPTAPPGLRMRPTTSAASLACQRLILINCACEKPRRRPAVSREPIGGGLDLKPHPHAACVALPSLARAARLGMRENACLRRLVPLRSSQSPVSRRAHARARTLPGV